jgi:hypothetical protein
VTAMVFDSPKLSTFGFRLQIGRARVEIAVAFREHVQIRQRAFPARLSRSAAKVHPVAVRKTPTVTMRVIATTKAMTVGTAAAIADGLLSRINAHFNLLCPLELPLSG